MLKAGADHAATGENAVQALRILLPMNQCSNLIVGVEDISAGKLVRQALDEIRKICNNKGNC